MRAEPVGSYAPAGTRVKCFITGVKCFKVEKCMQNLRDHLGAELFRSSRDDYCSSRRSSLGECVLGIILRAVKFAAAIVDAIARCSADAHDIVHSRCRVAATAAARRPSEAPAARVRLLAPSLSLSATFSRLPSPSLTSSRLLPARGRSTFNRNLESARATAMWRAE